jgi:hypothetical protein
MAILTQAQVGLDMAAMEQELREKVSDANDRMARAAIVTRALIAAFTGAHYQRGTFGSFPLGRDPVRNRYLRYIDDTVFDTLGLHCAESDMPNFPEPLRCLGRYSHPDVHGREASPGDIQRIRNYLDTNTSSYVSPWSWPDIDGFFPRRFMPGANTVYPSGFGRLQGAVVLGEACLSKQHFDCIGMVDYILTTVSGDVIDTGIRGIHNGVAIQVETVQPPANAADLVPGDLLTRLGDDASSDARGEHIGIVGVNGHVIDAYGERNGVVCRSYVSTEWERLCRLRRAFLSRCSHVAPAAA